jgi:opacity protein-like surface antigen
VEWGFTPNWSAKLEYLYFNVDSSNDFNFAKGSTTFPSSFRHADSESHSHTVRVGINYRFNWLSP